MQISHERHLSHPPQTATDGPSGKFIGKDDDLDVSSVQGINNDGIIDKLTKLALAQNQAINNNTSRGLRTHNNMTCVAETTYKILGAADAEKLAGMVSVRSSNNNLTDKQRSPVHDFKSDFFDQKLHPVNSQREADDATRDHMLANIQHNRPRN